MELLNLKMRGSHKSIPKEIHRFLTERSTLSVFKVASEICPSGTRLNYEASVLLAWVTLSKYARAKSKIWPMKSQYAWHSEDEFTHLKAMLKL